MDIQVVTGWRTRERELRESALEQFRSAKAVVVATRTAKRWTELFVDDEWVFGEREYQQAARKEYDSSRLEARAVLQQLKTSASAREHRAFIRRQWIASMSPARKGEHLVLRRVKDARYRLKLSSLEARREYNRAYRAANIERLRAYDRDRGYRGGYGV